MRAALPLLLVLACGRSYTAPVEAADAGDGIVDDTVTLPDPDPNFVDYITPDAVVQPGESRMFCQYVEQTLPELAVDQIKIRQGPTGHHVSVMTSTMPKPVGTFEDCTSPAANVNLRWMILTTGPLPPGTAFAITQGEQMVLQFHYVNATDYPVRVNAVIRFHTVPHDSVTTWAGSTIASDVNIDLTPGLSHHQFDCRLSAERQLLMMFPHMHEYGADISIQIGPDADHLDTMMVEDPWEPAYYNDPPWRSFDPQVTLPAGTLIRTSCSWLNDTGADLHYPDEMCLSFTWLTGDKVPATCDLVNGSAAVTAESRPAVAGSAR